MDFPESRKWQEVKSRSCSINGNFGHIPSLQDTGSVYQLPNGKKKCFKGTSPDTISLCETFLYSKSYFFSNKKLFCYKLGQFLLQENALPMVGGVGEGFQEKEV